MGFYNSVRHELLLIATKGSCKPDIPKLVDSVQSIERSAKHSEKPQEFYAIIESMYDHGRKLELFSRSAREGWDSEGVARAVEAEVAGFLGEHADKRPDDGRQRLVRHCHLPGRSIMTGIGAVEVCVPRVRDRLSGTDDRIRFSSAILPPYARRSKSLEVLIPILYLKGISTGDFAEALSALLGPNAGGLSASTIVPAG